MGTIRLLAALAVSAGVVGLALGSDPKAQGPSRPRPGLTAQQTKEAVSLSKGAMTELRKKTDGAAKPGADLREYVVGVELLSSRDDATTPGKDSETATGDESAKSKPEPEKNESENSKDGEKGKDSEKGKGKGRAPGPLAVVTWYRYFDDITVFSTVDLGTGKVVSVEAAQHLRTPLSNSEFEEAQALAREKSDEVKQLFERFGKELSAYPQFSQFTLEDDPRVNRVVHLTYRVGKRDLSYPRPQVNLSTRKVETPPPDPETEPEPKPRPRRPTE
jgi:hypothetical protein